ncbi:tail collar fiber protein [Vibrio phage VvAW1]|uniref:tail collar fiber protein n=1 Tax=Vibrio phage VvAW1 TaxID=1168281 RepID=UPI000263B067|nr:tail collar fiber protein [Vibrio phage VvAW1]AFH14478.1 phage tail collar protein [Vibrio phage VvAW1]
MAEQNNNGVPVGPPPLNVPIVDQMGMPTRAMSDFIHQLWQRSGGSEDNVDFILKLMTGGRQAVPKPVEQDEGASLAQMLAIVMSISPGVDPNQINKSFEARVPKGGIIMWSGASVPAGWALCDGQNDTPDLRDKFIRGAGGALNIGDTGGSNQETVNTSSVSTGITASSTASNTTNTAEAEPVGTPGTGINALTSVSTSVTTTINETSHNHSVTVNTVPEFYALAYIIKL